MKSSDIFGAVLVVGVITLAVNVYLAPRAGIGPGEANAVTTEAADPSPPSAIDPRIQLPTNAALLKLEDDGHYWAQANVEGTHVKFMVDTGASTVALTYRDAQRIGLRPDTLDYTWTIRTAGGEVKGASVLIDSIQIGRVKVDAIEAMVLRDGLDQSLLGMTFLSQLESYEFRRGNLILRQ
ncbi:MAG: TIGR02281 family clan AA aspartic protease [Pseudomonadota bacterium]